MSDRLIGAQFAAEAVDRCLDDAALLSALLDVEAALVTACAATGLIPEPAGAAIAACCRPEVFDADDIGRRAAAHASLVVPLVEDLGALVPLEYRRYVHPGSTSQDILDTATCLVVRDALDVIGGDLAATADTLAVLAHRHATDAQIGRTLLQHAEPTTFGLVCAGWLTGLDDARAGLTRVRDRLAAQVGGPVGTRARYGPRGPEVAAIVAHRLGLADPVLPWHTDRQRFGEVAAAVALTAGALATIARNVALLSQTEVAEVSEGSPGGSSAMKHKRNPVLSVLVVAGTQQVVPLAAGVLAGLAGEGQRAAGSWQAELPALRRMLSLLGGAAAHTRRLLAELNVDAERMLVNLEARPLEQRTGGVSLIVVRRAAGTLVDRALTAHADAGDAAPAGTRTQAGGRMSELGYDVSGPEGAPVLVLGPSLGSRRTLWDRQMPVLSKAHRVIRYDLLGHGDSAAPDGPYTIERLATSVRDLLDELGVRRFGYAGVSLAGMVGLWLAAHEPERVEKLAVVCTSAYLPPPERWTDRAAAVRAGDRETVADAVVERWFTPDYAAREPEVVAEYRATIATTDAEGYASCCEAIAGMDQRESLPRITAPTLVIAGRDDLAIPPEHGAAIAAAVPGARLVVLDNAAHLAAVEQADRVAELLTGFLEER